MVLCPYKHLKYAHIPALGAGSNVPVTCRSDANRFERQLADLPNSRYRPDVAVQL